MLKCPTMYGLISLPPGLLLIHYLSTLIIWHSSFVKRGPISVCEGPSSKYPYFGFYDFMFMNYLTLVITAIKMLKNHNFKLNFGWQHIYLRGHKTRYGLIRPNCDKNVSWNYCYLFNSQNSQILIFVGWKRHAFIKFGLWNRFLSETVFLIIPAWLILLFRHNLAQNCPFLLDCDTAKSEPKLPLEGKDIQFLVLILWLESHVITVCNFVHC